MLALYKNDWQEEKNLSFFKHFLTSAETVNDSEEEGDDDPEEKDCDCNEDDIGIKV